jgi:hypothetical protein
MGTSSPELPFQDVVDWLRSPEGEMWSEDRMAYARWNTPQDSVMGPNSYGDPRELMMRGMFSIKTDGE